MAEKAPERVSKEDLIVFADTQVNTSWREAVMEVVRTMGNAVDIALPELRKALADRDVGQLNRDVVDPAGLSGLPPMDEMAYVTRGYTGIRGFLRCTQEQRKNLRQWAACLRKMQEEFAEQGIGFGEWAD